MNTQPVADGQREQSDRQAQRRTYAPPRLVVYGTVQTLTQSQGGGQGSGLDQD